MALPRLWLLVVTTSGNIGVWIFFWMSDPDIDGGRAAWPMELAAAAESDTSEHCTCEPLIIFGNLDGASVIGSP